MPQFDIYIFLIFVDFPPVCLTLFTFICIWGEVILWSHLRVRELSLNLHCLIFMMNLHKFKLISQLWLLIFWLSNTHKLVTKSVNCFLTVLLNTLYKKPPKPPAKGKKSAKLSKAEKEKLKKEEAERKAREEGERCTSVINRESLAF